MIFTIWWVGIIIFLIGFYFAKLNDLSIEDDMTSPLMFVMWSLMWPLFLILMVVLFCLHNSESFNDW